MGMFAGKKDGQEVSGTTQGRGSGSFDGID
jgi:hypothetical protein